MKTPKITRRKRGKFDQRTQCRIDLWKCFGGRSKKGRLERGKAACKPKNIRLHTFCHTFVMYVLSSS